MFVGSEDSGFSIADDLSEVERFAVYQQDSFGAWRVTSFPLPLLISIQHSRRPVYHGTIIAKWKTYHVALEDVLFILTRRLSLIRAPDEFFGAPPPE